MAKTESLLQELVELKKTEMRRARAHRILVFIFVTLPFIALMILSIVATALAVGAVGDIAENFPEMMESFTEDQKDELFDLFIENARSNIPAEEIESYTY